jgi:hypothetical protein
MGRLRSAGIAVFPSPGNHDDQGGTNAYLMYNQYISDIVKSSRTFTGDRLYPDDYTDVCFTNTWNGVNVLVVTLRDTFSADQAAWAQQMAAKYPAYNVIAVMHEYLNGNGELGRETDPYFYAAHGEAYWQYFERIPNLIQVMCGHLWQNDGKGALTGAQWWRHISIGDSGNVVNEMLFDTQANPGGLGGVDFVRLYRWEPALNRIQASTYVTSTSAYVHTNEADFQMAVSALRKLK